MNIRFLKEINELSMNERVRKGHPGNMHLWWNRSPVDSSQELLARWFDNERQQGSSDSNVHPPKIVDPFSGFGGLTLAASEAGFSVKSGDLNPVAVILTKAISEIPFRFADHVPVSPEAEICMCEKAQGIAEDVRCYGNRILHLLKEKLSVYYPESTEKDRSGRNTYAWIWTRTVTCPNPACRCKMPLANSYILSKLKNREYYAVPRINGHEIVFDVLRRTPSSSEFSLSTEQQGNKIGSHGAIFKCPACGELTTDDYIKSMGRNHQLDLQLMAVGYEGPSGRDYVAATEEQIKAVSDIAIPQDIPLGELPDNTRWFSPPLFGMKRYPDLYTRRQLLLMTTLCELVCDIRQQIFEDALRSGMVDDGISLSSGGTGALAYSEGVSIYLTLVVGKIANFQSEICTWDNRNGNIRAAFNRQALPMTWVFAEGNPFSTVTGNFSTMLDEVVRSVKNLSCRSAAEVIQGDGVLFDFPQNPILFTELPYYDNVGYADLSDYFYVWMRRCLKDVYPDLFEKVVTSKEELTSVPEHFGGDAKKARQTYEEGIHALFRNFSGKASSEYSSYVFYLFGKSDEQALSSEGDSTNSMTGWENILDAIVKAGFHIEAILPVRTEQPQKKTESTRVCIIFKKRSLEAPQTTRRGFISEMKKELPELLQTMLEDDIDIYDRPIVGMGYGLTLFSRYRKIMNADGTGMSVHDALQIIWTEVTEYLEEVDHAREL